MGDNDKGSQDTPGEKISQIPLLNEIVFDSTLPLKPPPQPRGSGTKQPASNHGPDYDPGTLDLFEDRDSVSQSSTMNDTEQGLRAGASRMVDALIEEYSAEITQRLRMELTEQLDAILGDLSDTGWPDDKHNDPESDEKDNGGLGKPSN
jgi:hypothetical protein